MEITQEHYALVIQDLFSRDPIRRTDCSVMEKVLKAMGNPQEDYPLIHVAGTNGKGQVSSKIASALQHAGYRVGLFISPHLFSYEDRISINGVKIPKETVVKYYWDLKELLDHLKIYLNFFECTTCLCFRYFKEQKIGIAVIEAGLGGKLDATNVIHPLVSVITSVSYDHTEILGKTLEEIAEQKAGIIKPNTPIVVGPRAKYHAIFKRAEEVMAPLHTVEEQGVFFDVENKAVAKEALSILDKIFRNLPRIGLFPRSKSCLISKKAIEAGLKFRMPCRFEKRGNLILDVAHNPDGFARLADALKHFYPNQTFRFFIGMSKTKDIKGCFEEIKSLAHFVHFVKTDRESSATPEELAEIFKTLSSCPYAIEKSIEEGIKKAKSATNKEEILVVCGSFYIMAKAIKPADKKSSFFSSFFDFLVNK